MQQRFPAIKAIKWWLWIAITLSFPIGAGGWGLLQLIQMPELPDCLSELRLQDSAASVFYCAKTIADEQDVNKLYTAIELVDSVPMDDPQRPMAERLIQEWSQSIIRLGENAFQQGDIDAAVEIVKQIPVNVSVHKIVDNQIKKWNSIWSKAEDIYENAVVKINEDNRDNYYLALLKAKELLKLGNDYWATTKYQELVAQIQEIKEKNEEQEASEKKQLQVTNTQELEKINQWEQEQEVQDLAYLKKARELANSGKIEDMIDAISEASMVTYGRHYEEAQTLIAQIRQQIEVADDRSSLEKAKELASQNDLVSLEMAINEASIIQNGHPLYKEASEQISKWTERKLKLQSQNQFENKGLDTQDKFPEFNDLR